MLKTGCFGGFKKSEYKLIFWLWQADKLLKKNKFNCFTSLKRIYLKPYLNFTVYGFMSDRSALIVGATGLVGKNLVKQILNDQAYGKVKIAVRNRIPLEHNKLEQHILISTIFKIIANYLKQMIYFAALGLQ